MELRNCFCSAKSVTITPTRYACHHGGAPEKMAFGENQKCYIVSYVPDEKSHDPSIAFKLFQHKNESPTIRVGFVKIKRRRIDTMVGFFF